MADTKTSALGTITGANTATGDKFPILDVSDTTQGAGGTLKAITRAEMVAALDAAGMTVNSDLGTAAAAATGDFATAAQGGLADSALQPGDVGTAAAQDVGYFATAAQGSTADSALQGVVDDTTPQLGGSLDVNGNKIVSVTSGNIDIEPHGTGNVLLGNFTFDADQTVGAGQDNYVLTYDHAGGVIALEAAAGGGGGAFTADVNTQITPATAIVLDQATGNEIALALSYTTNKATSGNDTGLRINQTDTASPGTSLLLDCQVGGSSKAYISAAGEGFFGVGGGRKALSIDSDGTDCRIRKNESGTGWLIIDSNNGAILSATGITTTGHQFSASASSAEYTRIIPPSNKIVLHHYLADYTIESTRRNGDETTRNLLINAQPAWASATTNIVGGTLTLRGGHGASGSAGNAHGGNVVIQGGTGYGTGTKGAVTLDGSGRAAFVADATDLASALTLVNALKAALISHGLMAAS